MMSHDHVLKSLQRMGATEHIVEVVRNLYSDATIAISVGHEMTGKIDISQGVKQGDPLSPTLFNIVMDPLFQQLKVKGQAKTLGDENKVKVGEVYCLAYADDTALIADSHKDNQVNIYLTWEFCEAVG